MREVLCPTTPATPHTIGGQTYPEGIRPEGHTFVCLPWKKVKQGRSGGGGIEVAPYVYILCFPQVTRSGVMKEAITRNRRLELTRTSRRKGQLR